MQGTRRKCIYQTEFVKRAKLFLCISRVSFSQLFFGFLAAFKEITESLKKKIETLKLSANFRCLLPNYFAFRQSAKANQGKD